MIAHLVRAAALMVGLAALAALSNVQAQPPAYPPKDLPDPTKPSPKLEKILRPPSVTTPAAPGAVEKKAELRLRGRVINKDRALVILELNGQPYVMTVGGEAQGVKVLEINAFGVKLEVGPGKDVLVLH